MEGLKTRIRQMFCRHKDTQWMRKVERFQILSGERRYLVCQKCGKVIDSYFAKYD